MLTCKQFDDFMHDYLANELSFSQKLGCWLHLALCRKCSRFVRQYQRTIALGKKAFSDPDSPVPGSVPDELVNAAVTRLRKAERTKHDVEPDKG